MNEMLKALADQTRRDILSLLKEKGVLSAGEIANEFDITKASISHHLKILKDAKLVTSKRNGQNIMYRLNTTVFQSLISWIYDIKGVDSDEK